MQKIYKTIVKKLRIIKEIKILDFYLISLLLYIAFIVPHVTGITGTLLHPGIEIAPIVPIGFVKEGEF